jgi:outer membrane protein assembly factor BamD (BamD/ComL family)
MERVTWWVFVFGACGGSQQPARPEPPPPATPVVIEAAAPEAKLEPCDDPEHLKSAKNTYDCAVLALHRGQNENAAKLAQSVRDRFPYSKMAVLSELLYADILFANDQFEDAAEAYDLFIKFHPTHDQVEDVKKKRADAQARAKP